MSRTSAQVGTIRTNAVWRAVVILTTGLLVACSDPGSQLTGTPRPDDGVFAMLGSWSYHAEFRLPRLFSTDTLVCTISGARLDIGEPMIPTEYNIDGSTHRGPPWTLTGRLSAGSLNCAGPTTPGFARVLGGTAVEVSRALACATFRFQTQTPAGRVGILNAACEYSMAGDLLNAAQMEGRVSATDDARILDRPSGPDGRFMATKN